MEHMLTFFALIIAGVIMIGIVIAYISFIVYLAKILPLWAFILVFISLMT